MGFYVSLMGIFDPKQSFMTRIILSHSRMIYGHSQREAQKYLWEFMAH